MLEKKFKLRIQMDVYTLGKRFGVSDDLLTNLINNRRALSPVSVDASISLQSSLFSDSEDDGDDVSEHGSLGSVLSSPRRHLTIEDRIDTLRHEKEMLQIDADRKFQKSKLQYEHIIEKEKEKNKQLQKELENTSAILEKLRSVRSCKRDEFSDLLCPQNVYEELSSADIDSLTVKEFVLIKVFELTASLRNQNTTLRNENVKLKTHADDEHAQAEEMRKRLVRMEAINARERLDMETHIHRITSECDLLKDKHLESLKCQDELRDRANQYTTIRIRVDEVERDKVQLAAQLDHAMQRIAEAESNSNRIQEELNMANQQNEVLKVDKNYLQRQVDEMKRDVLRLEQTLERQLAKNTLVEDREERLRNQLLDAEQRAKSAYEERLAAEVTMMKEDNKKQLRDLNQAQNRLQEREIMSLRASKEEAIQEVDRLRQRIEDLQVAIDDYKMQLTRKDTTHHSDMTELRSQVKMRIFETENINMLLEEKTAQLRKSELHSQMLQEQMDILKQDFVAMETSSTKQLVELHSKTVYLEEKIQVYEALEVELDASVMEQARTNINSELLGLGLEFTNNAASDTTMIPIAAQRRVKHSILLAQKLVKAEHELESCKRELKDNAVEFTRLQKQLLDATELAHDASQPGTFFIAKLQQKDEIIRTLEARIDELESERLSLVTKLNKVIEAQQEMHKDLHKVISAKARIEDVDAKTLSSDSAQVRSFDHPYDMIGLETGSVASEASHTSSFFLHQQDPTELPAPKWYRKLRS